METYISTKTNDQVSTGLSILSFCIPIVGWVLYAAVKNETPVKAEACKKWAWIGFAANFCLILLNM